MLQTTTASVLKLSLRNQRKQSQYRTFLSLIQKPTCSDSTLQPALDNAVSNVRRHDPVGYLPGKMLGTNEMQIAYFAVRSFWVETGLRFGTTALIPANSPPVDHLKWWKEGIDTAVYDANASSICPNEASSKHRGHPTLQLLTHLRQQHNFSKCHFDDLLKGRFEDLDLKQYPDLAALENHAVLSCGSLMQLILESDGLFETEYPIAHRTAKLLGKAHGLTNALRTSIPVMSTTGKLIIPQELCERYGVKSPRYLLSALGQGDAECIEALRNAVRDIANRAIEYLEQARSLRQDIEVETGGAAKSKSNHVMGVFLPGLASEAFLKRLKDHNYDLTDRNLRHISWAEHASCSLRIVQAFYRREY